MSSTELKLAVIEVKAVGPVGESAFGVPSTDEQQQYVQDVIDSLNAAGGVGCRKLVAQFFTPDSVDQSSLQQTCLDVQQSGAFAVVDLGAYTAFAQIASCYPREGLAYFTSTPVSKRLVAQYYPLYFSSAGMNDVLIRNGVFAFKQRGQIDPAHGFKKLGVFYRSCVPDYWNTARDSLHQNGVSDADIVTYDMGCASAVFAPPSDVQQAVLKFRQAGVTHVMPIDENPDLGNFTHVAQSQGFKPRYLIANEDIVATVNSATANVDKQNFDGALSIDLASYPERTTPGVEPSAGTAKCNAIYAAKGKPPVYEQGVGMGGHVCTLLWMFAAAAGHATTISRASLADGLHTAKSADWSFPEGPNDYSASRATTGGQFWRPGQYSVDCDCWRLLDVNWHPSFP